MATLVEQPGAVRPPTPSKKQANAIRVSPLLIESSRKTADEVFALLTTSAAGLTQSDAEERLAKYGLNEVAREKRHGWLWRVGAAELKAMISVTATVSRDGQPKEVPLKEIVPGDVIKLAAGDMIPADVRLVSCKDLFIVQASLTGESLPVEKIDAPEIEGGRQPLELRNLCFLGTSVESGTARAVVVATGLQTYFGSMARSEEH